MESGGDFVEWLGDDMSIKVFLHLDDPSHLARLSAVSTACRNFVIANGLFKQLCFKLLPEMRSIVHFVEVKKMIDPLPVRGGGTNCLKLDYLTRNHRVFSQLTRGLSPVLRNDCISEAISASSTDNFPVESIWNTLEPHDTVEQGASYWSSKGQTHTTAPETLVYKLSANLCLVTEIHIQPFQAYFQYGFPIYSSKAVRFKLGHAKFPLQIQNGATVTNYNSTGSDFVWTYTSPEYPMIQENCLQKFKLPEPVLCVGGILQVELLGRVQRQEMDGLYYICISHVQAVGRPLMRPFDVEIVDPAGKCALKYCPQREGGMLTNGLAKSKKGGTSRLHAFTVRLMERGIRGWENMILNRLLRIGPVDENDVDDEHLDEHPLP